MSERLDKTAADQTDEPPRDGDRTAMNFAVLRWCLGSNDEQAPAELEPTMSRGEMQQLLAEWQQEQARRDYINYMTG